MRRAPLALALFAAACAPAASADEQRTAAGFPKATRPVSQIVSARWSNEDDRDEAGEIEAVLALARVRRGMTVADIGAGEGYYTIRLSKAVGSAGRVLAEDVVPDYTAKLADRIVRERLDNVSVRLGTPADPRLPAGSFDRIFMVHMYHEIGDPYEMLWRMHSALRRNGMVVVVDADRPTDRHGTPPTLLDCEFKAVGYRLVARSTVPSAGGYVSLYAGDGARPEPSAVKACVPPA
jgi:ubiquinone/menaquinone biosynthesis C-methylase UbiE